MNSFSHIYSEWSEIMHWLMANWCDLFHFVSTVSTIRNILTSIHSYLIYELVLQYLINKNNTWESTIFYHSVYNDICVYLVTKNSMRALATSCTEGSRSTSTRLDTLSVARVPDPITLWLDGKPSPASPSIYHRQMLQLLTSTNTPLNRQEQVMCVQISYINKTLCLKTCFNLYKSTIYQY